MEERVLVVDDDPVIVALVRDILSEAGYSVEAVASGAACLRCLALDPPDLVLLDVMLPGMNGLAVLSMIRTQEETRALPVIMLTARDQYDDKLWGQIAGADRYLTKPFNPGALVHAVRQVLGERVGAVV